MPKLQRNFLSSDEWLLKEKKWNEDCQHSVETRFALGNGYIGSRGILEENPRLCWAGTFFAGVYDSKGALTPEIVNAPNPIDFKIRIGGEKLDVGTIEHSGHELTLDMYKGILHRKTQYKSIKGERFDYSSVRFFSADDPHTAVLRVTFTPMDATTEIFVEHQVNLDTFNKGILSEGTKRHIHITEFDKIQKNKNYICTKTSDDETLIAYGTVLETKCGSKKKIEPHRTFTMKVKKGQTVTFTKYFSMYTSRDIQDSKISNRMKIYSMIEDNLKRGADITGIDKKSIEKAQSLLSLKNPKNIKLVTVRKLDSIYKTGFDKLLAEHTAKWKEKWEASDLIIKGNKDDQKAVRFNLYHLLIAGNEWDAQVSIPAKTLSGEGYSGHVFWDTEIFILPFFIHTRPDIAKNILMYRWHRLDNARKLAVKRGFKGAMFPWESESKGEEATPDFFKDVVGNVIRIYTGERENHIVSDVAYGVWSYFAATGDKKFMANHGMEILIDTARFWTSRVKKEGKGYSINKVIGPDELHENVDNSRFVNYCAAWNIKEAIKMYMCFKQEFPNEMKKLLSKLKLKETDFIKWIKIADKIKFSVGKDGIIEQFDGYYKKEFVPITKHNKHGMPQIPEYLDDVVKIEKTQLIKQSDIVMLLTLFSTEFSHEIKKKNYYYYLKRNTHKSSLSTSMEGIMAAEIGNLSDFYKHFKSAAYMDLLDVNKNAEDGVHAASLGGVWQMIFKGLLGFKLKAGKIRIRPIVIKQWTGYKINIKIKEGEIVFDISKKSGEITFKSTTDTNKISVNIYGKEEVLRTGKSYKFKIKKYLEA